MHALAHHVSCVLQSLGLLLTGSSAADSKGALEGGAGGCLDGDDVLRKLPLWDAGHVLRMMRVPEADLGL